MLGRVCGISVFVVVVVAGSLLSGPVVAGDAQSQRLGAVRLAMDNMGGGAGMMMMDDKMKPQGGQTGGMGGQQSGQPSGNAMPMGPGGSQGQMGETGGMKPQGSMGQGGGMMDKMMPMMENMMRMMNGNAQKPSMPGTTTGTGTVDLTDRIEGRIAFLRAELHITDAQSQTWNSFADAVRSSREHLIAARQLLNEPTASSADRLDRYERHLTERLAALKSARAAFAKLDAMLDSGQKRSAEELVVPFIATF